ncbi:putative DNA-binding protein [Melia azedarach]|uniref:DNA-binding protein n=1 Tax=Melia azedarach TaxID=155640 RepID=A0ACC1Y7U8_MELAZ|nr:putative DNA-binding protein [Melia azedarach]
MLDLGHGGDEQKRCSIRIKHTGCEVVQLLNIGAAKMSFQHKGFWMARDAGCLTDGEIAYDNSTRIEPKRGHQWFMDAAGTELFCNKKQAIEAVDGRPVSGISHTNVSQWHNPSSFQSLSGQFSDRLFGSEPVRTVNLVDRNIPSVTSGSLNVGRKDFQDQYNNASMGLSMSHFIEDPPCFNLGGIRKVKVNQVRDSGTDLSASMGLSYGRGDNSSMSICTTYDKGDNNSMSLGPNNINSNENTISMGHNFSKCDSSFISMGHTLNKGEENCISMGYNYSRRNDNISLMGQSFDKGDGSFISVGQSSEKDDSSVMSIGSYNKGHENFISMGQNYDKANETFISVGSSFNKGSDNPVGMAPAYDKADSNITSIGSSQDKGDSGVLSMGHNFNKGETNTISFGGYQDEPENPSGNIISGYDLLIGTQNSAQASQELSQPNLAEPNVDSTVNNTVRTNPRTDIVPKNKEPKAAKKVPANNFPSNVKSLLSTGMLDGVPVKYVSWSREKNLKGTIKGTGYLCGCNECNFTKALNAYEFERHAKCKTKHPNNHIYFENGKTIYAVVQELKNTPQEMLFEAIQNVTGSQINQKNFRIWKASYQAATRELQRIYGKDEIAMAS